MAQLSIRLLGAFEATLEGHQIDGFDSDKVRALLAYLVVEADRPHRREKLAGLLWPDYPDQSARTSLRRALANLRELIRDQASNPNYLIISRDSIQFNRESDYQLDEAEFMSLVRGEDPRSVSLEALQRAVVMYRGPFLDGFSVSDSPAFEEWAVVQREALQAKFLQLLLKLADNDESQGNYERSLDYVRQAVTLDTYQERAHRQFMRLLALNGQRNEAMEHYRLIEDLLHTDLGVEPEDATVALYQQIQTGELKPGSATELLGGTVTFLFTDIEGSTQLLRDLGEDYARLLADHHGIIQKVLDRWEGREVDQQGDAMFLSFQRATDAVNAAVDAQRMLEAHDWPLGVKVRVRMGLHSGEPLVVGDGYVGLDVHRAARIAHAGYGGQILLSRAVSELVKDNLPPGVGLMDLGYYRLKDLENPEAISQLAITDLPSQFPTLNAKRVKPPHLQPDIGVYPLPSFIDQADDFQTTRGLPPADYPFVAREAELDQLSGFLKRAISGPGEIVFVTGGAGRGKTALMQEFARRAMQDHADLLVVSGSCNAYSGLGDPYLPFRDILSMLVGDVEDKWIAGAITRDHALRLWQAFPVVIESLLHSGQNIVNSLLSEDTLRIHAAINLPENEMLRRKLDECIQRQKLGVDDLEQSYLFQQIVNVLRKIADTHPILIVLDDLQWADSASISLFFHLGRRIRGSRILILGAYRQVDIALGRDGERHPLEMVLSEFKREFGDVWIELGRVRQNEDRRFINLLLDTEPNQLDETFREALYGHTEGHPLFTIELLRTLQSRGTLTQNSEGRWMTTSDLKWGSLPSRVEGVIEERIGRLDDGLREVLNIACVEGETFSLQVIAQIKDREERELLLLLVRELDKKHGLIIEVGVRQLGNRRLHNFRFRHHLYQQYLYNRLGDIEREFLHRDIAAALEQLYDGETQGIAPQLAFHYGQSGNHEKAVAYSLEAAQQARERFANKEAIDNYNQALTLIPDDAREDRFQVILEREAVYGLMGNQVNRQEDLRQLISLASRSGDIEKQAEVALRRAKFSGTVGDYSEAISAASVAVDLGQECKNLELTASAEIEWGRALAFRGDLDEARRHLTSALELTPEPDPSTQANPVWSRIGAGSLNNLAYISNLQSDHKESVSYLEQALDTYHQLSDRLGESITLQNLGVVSYDMGDLLRARDCWEQAKRIYQEIGDRRHEAMVMNSLGNISSDLLGDYREARNLHEQALNIAIEVGDRSNEGMALGNLGLAAIGLRDFERARDFARQALSIYDELGLKPALSEIFYILGETMAGLNDAGGAIRNFEQSIRFGEEFDQNDPILKAQAGLASVSLESGDLQQAGQWVDHILTRLDDEAVSDVLRPETKYRVYLSCYRVLLADRDPRARVMIKKVYSMLRVQADRLEDQAIRDQFLENIPWHREIVEAYIISSTQDEEE